VKKTTPKKRTKEKSSLDIIGAAVSLLIFVGLVSVYKVMNHHMGGHSPGMSPIQ